MVNLHNNIRYVHVDSFDLQWGLTVTTAGCQHIPPHSVYPPNTRLHPSTHTFNPQEGRVLKEYQLVYIFEGSGFFESRSCGRQKVKAGTMILLFPDEWHTYSPEEEGWSEYWVGFKGTMIENWMTNRFFTKDKSLYEIGVNATIIGLYEEIVYYIMQERSGYQQLISSIVFYLMGEIYYKEKNRSADRSNAIKKIDEARAIMKNNLDNPVPVEMIAQRLGVSYSWFRRTFKACTGISPAQYQLHLRYLRAKELLSTSQLTISEVAYMLNFETISQFSTFFSKKEGLSPSQFRKRYKQ